MSCFALVTFCPSIVSSAILWAANFVASARFLVYLVVRTRSEGWDIQTRFAALAAGRERP